MQKTRLNLAIRALVGTAIASTGTAALSQEGDQRPARATTLEEVVVTANRREQNLQDVGISISALSGDELEARPLTTAGDITASIPNYQIVRSYATPGYNTQVTLRGVGQPNFEDTTEATATSYVDEFYMIGAGQADFLMFDLERVEVARGPQGTIQGRNSTAGTINFYTRKPDLEATAGSVSVSAGSYGLTRSDGYINVPLSDSVAFRGSFATDRNDGYVRNIHPQALYDKGGKNKFWAGRAQLLIEASETVSINLKAEHGEMGPTSGSNEILYPVAASDGFGTIAVESDAFGNSRASTNTLGEDLANVDGPNSIGNKIEHYLATVNWDASAKLSVVGLAGWLKSEKFEVEDCDNGPDPLCLFSNDSTSEHWTAELRANYEETSWRVTVGANYLDQDIATRSATPLFFDESVTPDPTGLLAESYFDQQELESWAIFAQGEYDLSPQLTLIAGARYTRDDKEVDALDGFGTVPLSTPKPTNLAQYNAIGQAVRNDPNALITRLNSTLHGDLAVFDKGMWNTNLQLNYRPGGDLLLYAAYRRGVKSGGFITGNVAGLAPDVRKYDEETNNAYELGFKATLMGGLARLNGAVFYYDYEDMQNTSFVNITNLVTNNDATVVGGELELVANPIEGLEVSGGIGVLDTEVKDISNPTGAVPFTGDLDLPLAPDFTGNLMARYTWNAFNGELHVQQTSHGRTSMHRDSLNNRSTEMGALFQTDLLIGYAPANKQWSVSGWVNNVFDTRHATNKFDLAGVGNSGELTLQMPRWYGVSMRVSF
jgi:iron complex outermembrane receptor protein